MAGNKGGDDGGGPISSRQTTALRSSPSTITPSACLLCLALLASCVGNEQAGDCKRNSIARPINALPLLTYAHMQTF